MRGIAFVLTDRNQVSIVDQQPDPSFQVPNSCGHRAPATLVSDEFTTPIVTDDQTFYPKRRRSNWPEKTREKQRNRNENYREETGEAQGSVLHVSDDEDREYKPID